MARWEVGAIVLVGSLTAYACSGTMVGSSRTVDVARDGGLGGGIGGQGGVPAQRDGGEPQGGGAGAHGDGGTQPDGGAQLDGGPQLDGGAAGDATVGTVSSPHSGTRIKVRGFTTPDGVTLAVKDLADGTSGLWDSTRNVACQMTLAQDGVTRCLPDSTGWVYFTDAACTRPVIEQGAFGCVTPGPYVTVSDPAAACSERATTAVYAIGAPIAAPTMLYNRSFDGCSAASGGTSGVSYFEASVSPPADWVSFVPKIEPVTSRLGVAFLAGTDGSLVPLDELRLLPDDVTCESLLGTDQRARCVPKHRSPLYADFTSSVYSGAKCDTPAVPWRKCSPPLDALADLVGQFDGVQNCGQLALKSPVHRATKVDPSDVFVIKPDTGVCTPIPAGDGTTDYYVAGAVIPETDLPTLDIIHEGSGRFQKTYVTTEGKNLYATGFYDTQTQSDCTPRRLGTGTVVCAPPQLPYASGAYADPGCSNALYDPNGPNGGGGLIVDTRCASPWSSTFALVSGQGGCVYSNATSPNDTLHRIGALHTGPTYTNWFSPVTCDQAPPSATTLYDLGPALDPVTVFGALTQVDL